MFSQNDTATSQNNAFNEFGLNFLGSVRYQWKPFLAFATEGSITLLPIAVGTSGNTVRLANFNADAIYPIWLAQDSWRIELLADYSYLTLIHNIPNFGFYSANFATVYPRAERFFSSGASAWLSAFYKPLIPYGPLGGSSWEAGARAGYNGIQLGRIQLEILVGAVFDNVQYSTYVTTGQIRIASYLAGINVIF